jgi:hypothetical protein
MELITKYKRELLGIGLGALGGFLYWNYVGCLNGQCALQATPTIDMLYGTVFGYLIFSRSNKDN